MSEYRIPKVITKRISELEIGDVLVNLGYVLEIEEGLTHFTLVISRLNEKQVIKFLKEDMLILVQPKDLI